MKRIAAVAVAVLALALVGTALAGPGAKLDKHSIGPSACVAGQKAQQLVDVHYRLLHDADSGFAGYWANDTIDRHLRIWSEPDGTYCVQVEDHGSFVTFGGASPGGASTVSAGVTGSLQGGYVTNSVTGTFSPTLATRGDLGAYDLQCDSSANCPGSAISWHDYFSSITGSNDFAQWGWIYRAGHHGTWLNQDSGSSGDITG